MRWFILLGLVCYAAGYIVFRSLNGEVEGETTVVSYPSSPAAVFYIFRPASLVDGYLTGAESRLRE
ncbi:MAG: hypothetical protein AAGE18_15815 [Pseudomonadota bacterium]